MDYPQSTLAMFDSAAQMRLQEKLGYEFWFLEFVSETLDMFEGGTNPQRITLKNRQAGGVVEVNIHDYLWEGKIREFINAMTPLTFTTAYKILDAIFEWILDVNHDRGNIEKVPWKFSEKVEIILRCETELTFPPLFQSAPYVREYLFALYSKSLKFRNEIVHKHHFLVMDGKLHIETVEKDESFRLDLSQRELAAFVRTSVMVTNLLTGSGSLGKREDRLLKYYLDQSEKLHSLPRFNQRTPILVHVVLSVSEEKGVFPADLGFVRENVAKIHPDADVLFDLEVVGMIDDHPSTRWLFKANSVPEQELFQLSKDSYEAYRIPLDGLQSSHQ